MNSIEKYFEPQFDKLYKKMKFVYYFSKMAKSEELETEQEIYEIVNKMCEEDGKTMTDQNKQRFSKEIKDLLIKTIKEQDENRKK
jgi:hypothetical protein